MPRLLPRYRPAVPPARDRSLRGACDVGAVSGQAGGLHIPSEVASVSALLVVAGLGATAFVVSKLVRRFVPEIVVFLALGVLVGPQGLRVISERNVESLELVTTVAVGAIMFLLGDRLRVDDLRANRGVLLPLNAVQIVTTGALVYLAARLAGADVQAAVLLALIGAETGVLTVTATVKEERAKGPFTERLLTSVGLTNVAVAALFGVAFPFVLAASGEASGPLATVLSFAQIVGGSTLVGLAGGWLLRRFGPAIETSGELLLYLLIVLIAIAGTNLLLNGSVVVSALVAGLYVANVAPWLADRYFAAVRTLEAPIYLVFFLVAGAGIHLEQLATVGLLGAAYLLARSLGKIGGSLLGGWLARPRLGITDSLPTGLAMLPHAGMAIALVAFVLEQAPSLGDAVGGVILGSIVVFELGGPLLTRRALRQAGERGERAAAGEEGVLPDMDTTHQIRRVLVPVGNLSVALPRLPFLMDLVGNVGAELIALHVSRPGSGIREEDEPRVLRLVRQVAAERKIPCRTVHRVSEQVAAAISEAATAQEVDLVVMGEPMRMSFLQPARWGLVSQRVVRSLDVPVLVYPVDPNAPADVPSIYLRRAADAHAADAEAGVEHAQEPVSERRD